MKAVVVSQPGRFEVRSDIPVPEPGPYEVLCRMCYGTTCTGTDLHMIDGEHPRPVPYPILLGHESVGRVVETGSRVRNLKVGDLISRVGCPAPAGSGLTSKWGGLAEYGVARDHWQMRKDGIAPEEWDAYRVNQVIHPAIDERTAPMIITWRETLSYVRRIGVGPGCRMLLVGSGANALSFAAHGYNLGAEVTVVGSGKKEAAFRRVPVQYYYDYRQEGLAGRIRDEDERPFDLILDGVGSSATVNALLPLLRAGGTVGVYGWNDYLGYALNPLRAAASFQVYAGGYDEEETHAEVQAMILRGQLRAEDWYDLEQPVPLERAMSAYDRLRSRGEFKVLISLS